jgi:predicted alpha/beta superfamily hydrolase
VLFGYSLGGVFTIQALMTEPEVFDSFIAGSSSLWYRFDYNAGLTLATAQKSERFRNRCLVMSSGEDGASINAGARSYQRLLDGLELPLITHYQRNAEIDHGHNRTISFVYGWEKVFNTDDIFPPPEAISTSSLAEFKVFVAQ